MQELFEQLTLPSYKTTVVNDIGYFHPPGGTSQISYFTLTLKYNGLGYHSFIEMKVYSIEPWNEDMEIDLELGSIYFEIDFKKFDSIAELESILVNKLNQASGSIKSRVANYQASKKQLTLPFLTFQGTEKII